ncbi:MAG: DUF3108 domain-containing protein [Gammaproteobacteria bacterium]
MWRNALLLVASLCVMNVQAAGLPPAFKANYVVKKGPFALGHSTRELRYGENRELVFVSSSDASGLVSLLFSEQIRETSRLKQDGERVMPLAYEYQRKGRRDRIISQQFDWKAGSVTSQINDAVYTYALHPDALDQSGYLVNLMIDLAKGARDISYNVARRGEMRTYDIEHLRDERLDTVLGELDTVVIQRKAKQTTTMWCAYDLHFLPVKIQHEEKGGVFTAYLESVEGLQRP